ncbi:hydrolase [Acrocarpospora phusangensis]|uniref:Hydrolase n=1 Tax=Acrocarpospora phusangensis TaxID=1070424 RepID=A0A919QDB5_9ACTN|nr:alpha/beta fold hydrolase [Acrocarpospora phusangensis]GIH25290.1 hydrolase [Acrocarpospora phusangensis]
MPFAAVNGVRLGYEIHGTGEPIVLVMGAGAGGAVWRIHQVPALVSAGYQALTFDNRGLPENGPNPGDFGIDDMVSDTIALIEQLGWAPCRAVGLSLGSMILQEVALARPDLLSHCVLLATRGRTDAFRAALIAAETDLLDRHLEVPGPMAAVLSGVLNLSPATLDHDQRVRDWLGLFEMSPRQAGPGIRAQYQACLIPDRLEALAKVSVPTMVVAFEHDRLTPPHLGREVADAIPGCLYRELPGCGHFAHLEQPALVNAEILRFFADPLPGA